MPTTREKEFAYERGPIGITRCFLSISGSQKQRVDHLISKIITLESNPHYRMGDVIYRKGLKFRDSTEKVLSLPQFDGTILKNYILAAADIETPDIPLLSRLTEQAVVSRKFKLAREDELVVHIRAGDVVEFEWFLQGNLVEQIGKFANVFHCSLVICFSFGDFQEKGLWLFDAEKLQKNVSMITTLLEDLIRAYPQIHFDVVSNVDVDQDFVYMVNAPHFIRDRGGFSDLVCEVRAYREAQGSSRILNILSQESRSSSATADKYGKRILVACHEMEVAGGLYRFERVGRVIQRFGHHLSFLAFGSAPHQFRQTDFPVLTFEEAVRTEWDATFVPGVGFPDDTIDRFAQLRDNSFGVRVQHILNDMTRKPGFLKVNRSFAPHVVIFNNRHWRAGDFTDFEADAFHFLEGAVDLERFAPDSSRVYRRTHPPFVVGGQATKNVEPLIQAIRLCDDDVHLYLFGPEGDLAERTRDLLEAGRLRLFGTLRENDLPAFYADIDCVAHTETFAGWANLAAESMASGVPVICTPHGTAAFAEHESTALMLSEPSPQALADSILKLRMDPSAAAYMARRARQRISSFSWTSYSADLLRLSKRPAFNYYTRLPEWGLFGKWPEALRMDGLELILENCDAKSVCDLGSGDGVVSRRLLERGASVVHGFEQSKSRVALANQICQDFAGSHFWEADLTHWIVFEVLHKAHLKETYDIVLYLGLHHHLPPENRMRSLKGAASRASDWLAVRTPDSLFHADGIESALANLGFSLVASKSDTAAILGSSHIFKRQ
jgi:glycosyltransferase involved in cell wall biosynthesis